MRYHWTLYLVIKGAVMLVAACLAPNDPFAEAALWCGLGSLVCAPLVAAMESQA